MKSAFFEFTVANSALFTAKGALNVVAHNVANASTRGYSRQVVEQRASWPLILNTGKGMVGTGSEIYGIAQMRDVYLDKKYWRNVSSLGEYTVKQTQLSLTETILNEMNDTGLKTQFNDFFGRIQELSKDAGDSTYRTNLIQLADSICTFFDNTYQQLHRQQTDINEEIKATVSAVNSLAKQIASLNKQISQYELTGQKANDLRDQRARLIDDLSQYANITVEEKELNEEYAAGKFPKPEDRGKSNKVLTIVMNGHALVDGFDCYLMEVRERKVQDYTNDPTTPSAVYTNKNPEDMAGLYDIYWSTDGAKFNMYSNTLTGQLKALIDMRDGNNKSFMEVQWKPGDPGPSPASLALGTPPSLGPPPTAGTATTLTIDLNPPNDRVDLSRDGGVIRIYDAEKNTYKEYSYSSYSYSPLTKQGTFTLTSPEPPTVLAPALPTNYRITVGEASSYKGLPYYMSRLNDLARTVVQAMNTGTRFKDGAATIDNYPASAATANGLKELDLILGMNGGHLDGWNANGEKLDTLFFTYMDTKTNAEAGWDGDFNIYYVTAESIRMNRDLIHDPRLLQASDEQTGGISNNNVVLSFLKVSTDKSLFKEGTLGDYIIGMTGELGVEYKQTINFVNSYGDMTTTIDNQRMSVSGVDLNEEMTAMILYQQQYVAASKLINVIDAIYDTTVNRLGAF